jgi:hypothetical protein
LQACYGRVSRQQVFSGLCGSKIRECLFFLTGRSITLNAAVVSALQAAGFYAFLGFFARNFSYYTIFLSECCY